MLTNAGWLVHTLENYVMGKKKKKRKTGKKKKNERQRDVP